MRIDARLILIGLFIAGSLYAGKKIVSMVRGIRNNNPGNIRLSGTVWQGQVPASEQTDAEYVQFKAPEYGIRAMARILESYAGRGITTLAGIVSTWAPPTENDTESYIRSVAQRTGLSADTTISKDQYPGLIAAIIQHENGLQPYDAATLARGVALA